MAPKSPLRVYSWNTLSRIISDHYTTPDFINGPTNAHANLRLFGNTTYSEKNPPRITLFRDNHAWCPYCQKIWLFLEEKQIPYAIKKVTMFCYGEKEPWFLRIVRSGMLPALKIDNDIITESDDILARLEKEYGPLGKKSMHEKDIMKNRDLERHLFRAWCNWLCTDHGSFKQEEYSRGFFHQVAKALEQEMNKTPSSYFAEDFGISDVILTPYIERMQSSLFYYKGFNLRKEHPRLDAWFNAMESREIYRGTKSDHHTHSHDLPPQMGRCSFDVFSGRADPKIQKTIDDAIHAVDQQSSDNERPLREIDEKIFKEDENCRLEAVARILKFHDILNTVNPYGESMQSNKRKKSSKTKIGSPFDSCTKKESTGTVDMTSTPFDISIRAVCTILIEETVDPKIIAQVAEECGDNVLTIDQLPAHGAHALRYLRDRISIPRDMGFWAGRRLRQTCEKLAREYGDPTEENEHPIPTRHRRDTSSVPFVQKL